MITCFTKHGDIIREYSLLQNEWKDNCVELTWDISEYSKKNRCLVISQYGFESKSSRRGNLDLIIIPNIKNRILRKLFNNIYYKLKLFKKLRKNRVTHFIPADAHGFDLFLFFTKMLKIEVIPNLSRLDHVSKKYIRLFKLFKLNKFIVPGKYYKNELLASGIGSETTIRIRQPKYPERFFTFREIPVFNGGSFKVLFTGRLIKEKGIYEFLEAAISVSKRNDNCTFYIAGDGVEQLNIKRIIDLEKVSSKIHLLGSFSNLEIGTLMMNADVIVFPTYTEGFAKTWIESILTCTPIILTPLPAITDILKDGVNSFYIPLKNSAAIETLVTELSKSPGRLDKIRDELSKTKAVLIKQSNGNFKECVEFLISRNEHS